MKTKSPESGPGLTGPVDRQGAHIVAEVCKHFGRETFRDLSVQDFVAESLKPPSGSRKSVVALATTARTTTGSSSFAPTNLRSVFLVSGISKARSSVARPATLLTTGPAAPLSALAGASSKTATTTVTRSTSPGTETAGPETQYFAEAFD